MNIRDIRDLKNTAAQRLSGAPQANRVVMIYAGITMGLAALVTVADYCLGLEISQTGGLSNIGRRSILSTIQTILTNDNGDVVATGTFTFFMLDV